MKNPNPIAHFYISIAKSFMRILAGLSLCLGEDIVLAGALLVGAELLGIMEEMF